MSSFLQLRIHRDMRHRCHCGRPRRNRDETDQHIPLTVDFRNQTMNPMQAIEKVLNWILMSSNNPEEVSLTVKGILINAIPSIMFVAGLAHLNLGSDTLT